MRIIFLGLFILFTFVGVNAQSLTIKAKVDQRIELTSIIARLAEYDEYVRNDFKIYADDVDKHFAKYKNHPAVEFARQARESNGIGFDAVPSLAVHLNPNFTQKIPFSASVPDTRWGKQKAEEFAKLLQKFYKDANCETFFNSHADLYKIAEERMQTIVNKVDFQWYKTFYGEMPKGTINLFIGLLNGGMNFGPKVVYTNGKEELFAIIGTWKIDEKGLPLYDDNFLPTIIHEFNHSFINHLVAEKQNSFTNSGNKVFLLIKERMRRLAYGSWETTVQESLVRAAVTRYLFEHNGIDEANQEVIIEKGNGFVWMDELFTLLGTYENNRKNYPTFRTFIPILAGYYTDLAKRIEDKDAKFEQQRPKIVAIEEFKNEAQDVDSNLIKITLVFDRPLSGKGYSINQGKSGEDHFPIEKVVGYNDAKTKFTVQVKLKPDWDYEFVVTGLSFRSVDGYPLQQFVVKFKTKKQT